MRNTLRLTDRALIVFASFALAFAACAAEEPKGPQPYTEPQTGIVFPVTLGNLTLADTHKFDKPGLGVAVRYVADELGLHTDVYIYDLGKKGLGTGANSAEVKAAFDLAKSDIQKAGYKNIKTLPTKPVALKVADKPLPMLIASYELTKVIKSDAETTEITVVSHLLITAYKNQFLKIRMTYPLANKEKGAETLKGFLEALGPLLK